jgi:hypothetical protein
MLIYTRIIRRQTSNKLAKAVMHLSCVGVVPDSNLHLDTNYSDRDFSWFFSVPPGEFRNSTLNEVMATYVHILYI